MSHYNSEEDMCHCDEHHTLSYERGRGCGKHRSDSCHSGSSHHSDKCSGGRHHSKKRHASHDSGKCHSSRDKCGGGSSHHSANFGSHDKCGGSSSHDKCGGSKHHGKSDACDKYSTDRSSRHDKCHDRQCDDKHDRCNECGKRESKCDCEAEVCDQCGKTKNGKKDKCGKADKGHDKHGCGKHHRKHGSHHGECDACGKPKHKCKCDEGHDRCHRCGKSHDKSGKSHDKCGKSHDKCGKSHDSCGSHDKSGGGSHDKCDACGKREDKCQCDSEHGGSHGKLSHDKCGHDKKHGKCDRCGKTHKGGKHKACDVCGQRKNKCECDGQADHHKESCGRPKESYGKRKGLCGSHDRMDHQEHQDNHGFRCEDLCSKCAQELNCDDTGDLHHSSSHSSQGHHQSSSHSGCSRKTGSVCDSKPKGSHSSLSGHHRGCSGSRHRLSACPSDISIDENCPIHGKLSRSHHGEDSPSSAGSECKATACQQKPQVRFSDCDTTGPDGLAARDRSPSESRSHSRHRTEPPARSRSGQPGRDVGKTLSGKDFPQKGQTSCEPQITLSVHRSKSHSSRRSSKPRATDSPACSARNFNESKMKFDLVFENICENLSDEMYRIQKDECITCCVPSYITKGKSKMGGRQSKCDGNTDDSCCQGSADVCKKQCGPM
ncbi:hypothetical protein M8J76_010623 [Diaphorina citri]|nr:hypothetical protein M8J76_010623 [Diaphorina citri]